MRRNVREDVFVRVCHSLPKQLLFYFSFSLFPTPSSLISASTVVVHAGGVCVVVTTGAVTYQWNRGGVELGTGLESGKS